MSPVDSAIASATTSGVTTEVPSVVAEGDLEKFEDEDQFQQPPSAGGYGFQGYPDQQQQARGMYVCMYTQWVNGQETNATPPSIAYPGGDVSV